MFNNEILEVERKALILFLSQISLTLNMRRKFDRKTRISQYHIYSDDKKFSINFDFQEKENNTSNLLRETIKYVFDEFDFVLGCVDSDMDMLDQIALFHNGIINKLQEDQYRYPTIVINTSKPNNLTDKISHSESKITKLYKRTKFENAKEEDVITLCEYLLDHICIMKDLFSSGTELLDFLDATIIVQNCINEMQEETFIKFLCDTITSQQK